MIYDQKYDLAFEADMPKIIKVIGVGGAGCNAVRHMHSLGIHDVDVVACNTDLQVLKKLPDDIKRIQLGIELTKGLGAGAKPEVGEKAALESEEALISLFESPTEMVFITAGMGGGTGTGAAPVLARLAQERDMLTIGVVTDPFTWEGTEKIEQALEGIERMKQYCDTVLIVKNQRLEEFFEDLTVQKAFENADQILANGVKSIAELITKPGIINLDFADVKTVLKNAGQAVMGSAEASGPNRAQEAVENALKSPLLHNNNIKGSKRLLVSISHSDELPEYEIKLKDQTMIMRFIESQIKSKAKIVKHGYTIDRSLGDKLRVTIVAAGVADSNIEDTEDKTDWWKDRNANNQTDNTPGVKKPKEKEVDREKMKLKFPIFEKELRMEQLSIDYMENKQDKASLKSEPAISRYQVNLTDINEISEDNMLISTLDERLAELKL